MKGKIPVKEIMKRDVVTIDIKSDVKHLAKKMLRRDVGSVIITDKKKPVGIVTKRDIFKKIVSKNIKPDDISIKELMTTPLITIPVTEDMTSALHKMVKMDVRRLPVVENKELVGIVTDIDLIAISPEMSNRVPVLVRLAPSRLPGVPRNYPKPGSGQDKESNKSKEPK